MCSVGFGQGAMKGDAKGVKDLAQAATYVSELRNCMNRPGIPTSLLGIGPRVVCMA